MKNAQNAVVVANPSNVMAAIVNDAKTVAKGKVENYSAEVTTELLAAYADGKTVEQLAALFGKTARSIVAKLSREKVYTKKEYVTKAGTKPESKEEMIVKIAELIDIEPAKLESLEKANKGVLKILFDALNGSAELFEAATE
jgi:vacuolar-type H+-ATPase subunit B/Vma2